MPSGVTGAAAGADRIRDLTCIMWAIRCSGALGWDPVRVSRPSSTDISNRLRSPFSNGASDRVPSSITPTSGEINAGQTVYDRSGQTPANRGGLLRQMAVPADRCAAFYNFQMKGPLDHLWYVMAASLSRSPSALAFISPPHRTDANACAMSRATAGKMLALNARTGACIALRKSQTMKQ